MAFNKKGAPSARSLNDPEGVAQASQRSAGNSGYNIDDLCYSSGVSPVNSKGQVTNKDGMTMNWPYNNFTEDNLIHPNNNPAAPPIVSNHKSTSGKGVSVGGGNMTPGVLG